MKQILLYLNIFNYFLLAQKSLKNLFDSHDKLSYFAYTFLFFFTIIPLKIFFNIIIKIYYIFYDHYFFVWKHVKKNYWSYYLKYFFNTNIYLLALDAPIRMMFGDEINTGAPSVELIIVITPYSFFITLPSTSNKTGIYIVTVSSETGK